MKLRRIFAAIAACAVAATMAISASAVDNYSVPADKIEQAEGTENFTVQLFGADEDGNQVGLFSTIDEVLAYNKVKLTVSIDEADAAKAATGEVWVGGGVGLNSDSTGWASTEISFQDGVKPLTWTKVEDGVYTAEFDLTFVNTDTFAQIWFQNWSSADASMKLTGVELSYVEASADDPSSEPAEDPSSSEAPKDDSTKPADDNTNKNPGTGATAGLALAGLALAGAAVVAAKKSK